MKFGSPILEWQPRFALVSSLVFLQHWTLATPPEGNRALVCLVPHTTAIRNSRFEVLLKIRFLKPGAFDVQNIVTVPYVKLIRKLGELTEQEMKEINDRLKFWLNLD